jgi:hypothetical protein
MPKEIFESSTRNAGDYAGVFERDNETSYFYLFNLNGRPNKKILGAIQIKHDIFEKTNSHAGVKWNRAQTKVALIFDGNAIAMFSVPNGKSYGSVFTPVLLAPIPSDQSFS